MNLRNRKGDVTITTVILIVLGLAVLVMLIVGFTKGWDFFFGIFDSGPSELQTVAKACLGYAQASLTIDFCKYRLIDTDGNDEIVNCRDGRILASLTEDNVDTSKGSLRCEDTGDALKKDACDKLVSDNKLKDVKLGVDSCCKYYNPGGSSCNGVSGAAAAPTCTGTATACSTLTAQGTCQTQTGCTWS